MKQEAPSSVPLEAAHLISSLGYRRRGAEADRELMTGSLVSQLHVKRVELFSFRAYFNLRRILDELPLGVLRKEASRFIIWDA